jgi:hypothetical protein
VNVKQLRDILAMYPGDMTVFCNGYEDDISEVEDVAIINKHKTIQNYFKYPVSQSDILDNDEYKSSLYIGG